MGQLREGVDGAVLDGDGQEGGQVGGVGGRHQDGEQPPETHQAPRRYATGVRVTS